MFGYSTHRETWNNQWGPEPVAAFAATAERRAPITLPGQGAGTRRTVDAQARRFV